MVKRWTFHFCLPLQIGVRKRQNEVEVHFDRLGFGCVLNLTILSIIKHPGCQVSAFSVRKYFKPRLLAAALHSASYGTSIKSPPQ